MDHWPSGTTYANHAYASDNYYAGSKGMWIWYDVRAGNPSGEAGYWTQVANYDARNYKYLSLWAKGSTGTENFRVRLKTELTPGNFVEDAGDTTFTASTTWTQVIIPLVVYDASNLADLDNINVYFHNSYGGNQNSQIWIDDVRFVQEEDLPPPAPTGAASAASGGDNLITWTAIPSQYQANLAGYNVYRKKWTTTDTATKLTAVPFAGTTYSDASLPAADSTVWEYYVTAVSSKGPESAKSGTVTAIQGNVDLNYSDSRTTNAFGQNDLGAWGGAINTWIDTTQKDGSTGKSRYVSAANGAGVFSSLLDVGVTADGVVALTFDAKGASGGETFLVGFKDGDGVSPLEVQVSIATYGGALTTSWKRYSIPLDDFTGINFTKLDNISFSLAVPSANFMIDNAAFSPSDTSTVVMDHFDDGITDFNPAISGGGEFSWGGAGRSKSQGGAQFWRSPPYGLNVSIVSGAGQGFGQSFDWSSGRIT